MKTLLLAVFFYACPLIISNKGSKITNMYCNKNCKYVILIQQEAELQLKHSQIKFSPIDKSER